MKKFLSAVSGGALALAALSCDFTHPDSELPAPGRIAANITAIRIRSILRTETCIKK